MQAMTYGQVPQGTAQIEIRALSRKFMSEMSYKYVTYYVTYIIYYIKFCYNTKILFWAFSEIMDDMNDVINLSND